MKEMTPADDAFHAGAAGDLFWTETIWLGFAAPEHRLTGVLYPVFRPNQGVCSLGVYVWDDSSTFDQESLYYQNYWHLPVPSDLSAFDLPFGFSHRVCEPLSSYEVRYDDGAELAIELRYEGLHPPVGRGHGDAVDGSTQLCHVTGSLRLNGVEVEVDGHELRARAWASRADRRFPLRSEDPLVAPGYSDTFAACEDGAFLIGTAGTMTATTVHGGYLLRDGDLQPIVEGERSVVRRSDAGHVEELVVECVDAAGRALRATGTCVNHLLMQATPGVLLWVNGTRWDVDGQAMWGEDQDVPGGRVPRFPAPTEGGGRW